MYAIEVAEAAHHSKAELRSLRGSASCQAANERSREAANQLQMLQVGHPAYPAASVARLPWKRNSSSTGSPRKHSSWQAMGW